jgi:hypothetical protein
MATEIPDTLPQDFLRGPAPKPSLRKIDFTKTPLGRNYDGLYAVMVDGIMSPDECNQLVAAAEKHAKWEQAMINVGAGQQELDESTRKCGRIMWDNQEILDRIWARVAPMLPELQKIDGWIDVTKNRHSKLEFTRLNERMRILKYAPGGYFKRMSPSMFLTLGMLNRDVAHWDGSYVTPDGSEQSYFTLHLYLNDREHQANGETLSGGATTFWSWNTKERYDVDPKMGSILIFQHEDLLHSGDDLVSGTKITLRTDLMYKNRQK